MDFSNIHDPNTPIQNSSLNLDWEQKHDRHVERLPYDLKMSCLAMALMYQVPINFRESYLH
jgi:hypothetical protein